MKPERFEKNGQQFVAVPLKIYEQMAEDAEMLADIAAADAAKAEMARSNAVGIPLALVKRMLDDGIHPLAAWRDHRGHTQAQLAEKSGVSRDLIAHIERRSRNGSTATLRKLATALQVGIENLLED
jgi:DNA-binding XRE family transcriptional regulator